MNDKQSAGKTTVKMVHVENRGYRKRELRKQLGLRVQQINDNANDMIDDKYLHSYARRYGVFTSKMVAP